MFKSARTAPDFLKAISNSFRVNFPFWFLSIKLKIWSNWAICSSVRPSSLDRDPRDPATVAAKWPLGRGRSAASRLGVLPPSPFSSVFEELAAFKELVEEAKLQFCISFSWKRRTAADLVSNPGWKSTHVHSRNIDQPRQTCGFTLGPFGHDRHDSDHHRCHG